MTGSACRLECLKQAVLVCSKQPSPGGPRSDDVVRIAQKFFEWVMASGPRAQDMEEAE